MTPDKDARLRALLDEVAELLFEEADAGQLTDLEGLEGELRRLGQEHLFPALAAFFVRRVAGAPTGHPRQVHTVLGTWTLSSEQARRLQVPSHRQLSPLLERCVLIAAAKTSFAQAEQDLAVLCGVSVSDSTVRRLAVNMGSGALLGQAATSSEANADAVASDAAATEAAATEAAASLLCVDGGLVRLAAETGGTQWRQYKALCLDGGKPGSEMLASLEEEAFLVQRLQGRCTSGVVCIGDGHEGVWKTVAALPLPARQEVLDWYHLKENVWKQPWGRARKQHIESLLWSGQLEDAWQAIAGYQRHRGTLSGYLEQHWQRIPQGASSYAWRQEQGLPIGSGSVESAIKQIDARLQLPGAWWSAENVNPMLDLRCAYLNGWLYT